MYWKSTLQSRSNHTEHGGRVTQYYCTGMIFKSSHFLKFETSLAHNWFHTNFIFTLKYSGCQVECIIYNQSKWSSDLNLYLHKDLWNEIPTKYISHASNLMYGINFWYYIRTAFWSMLQILHNNYDKYFKVSVRLHWNIYQHHRSKVD